MERINGNGALVWGMNNGDRMDEAREILRRYWGYDDFRTGQASAISAILQGRDTLTIMPTGGGKSVCYQVPSMLLPGVTVGVSPLISLMKDQVATPRTFVAAGDVGRRETTR